MKIFADSSDIDQMLNSVASDMYLHHFPVILLGVSRIKWVKTHIRVMHKIFMTMAMFCDLLITSYKTEREFSCIHCGS